MHYTEVAKEIFQVLRSFDYTVELYSEDRERVFEPEEARIFFAKPNNLLLAIVEDGEDSKVKLYISKDTEIGSVLGLSTTLRMMATKYNMVFSFKQQDGVISPKDFATKSSVTETRSEMKLTEGMYGTSRSSYLQLENARMIVRHSAKVNENMLGARGRNIESIHIESPNGERYLFPTKQLAPARAMAHHVSNGGHWSDEGGETIGKLGQKFADLGTMSRHIYLNAGSLDESAQDVRLKVRESMRGMRKTFEGICRKTRYADVMEAIQQPLVESDDGDLMEEILKLKTLVEVAEKPVDDRVFETVCRALREIEQAPVMTEADPIDDSKRVMGVNVTRDVWDDFLAGNIDFRSEPHEPSPDLAPRVFVAVALEGLSEKCVDMDFSSVLLAMSYRFSSEKPASRAERAFAAKVMAVVGWNVPTEKSGSAAIKDLGDWFDGHRMQHEPEEEIHEDDMLEDDDSGMYDIVAGGEDDDSELSMEDIILPTNQGTVLADEVTVPTIHDPDTDTEELPSTDYINRLRALSGVNNRLNRGW